MSKEESEKAEWENLAVPTFGHSRKQREHPASQKVSILELGSDSVIRGRTNFLKASQ